MEHLGAKAPSTNLGAKQIRLTWALTLLDGRQISRNAYMYMTKAQMSSINNLTGFQNVSKTCQILP